MKTTFGTAPATEHGEPVVTFTQQELNRTPFSPGIQQVEYMEHPDAENDAKLLRVDKRTGIILKTADTQKKMPVPYKPIPLPLTLQGRPQPNVFSCSRPGVVNGVNNLGCWAANGCTPFLKYELAGLPPPQPHMCIVHKDGHYDSSPCYNTYAGVTDSGRPTAQVQLLAQGWELVTDRTSIREKTIIDGKRVVLDVEIPNLGPEYDEIKRKQAKEREEAAAAGEPTAVENGEVPGGPSETAPPPKAKRKYTKRKKAKKKGEKDADPGNPTPA